MNQLWPVAAGAFLFALFLGCREVYWRVQSVRRELHWYRQLIQRHQGGSAGFGNYNLISFDKGRTWWNCETTDEEPTRKYGGCVGNFGFTLTGPADPKLLEHIDGLTALLHHCQRHGPIDLANPGERRLLVGAGFEVKGAT